MWLPIDMHGQSRMEKTAHFVTCHGCVQLGKTCECQLDSRGLSPSASLQDS